MHGKIVLENGAPLNKEKTAATGVKRGEDIALGEMDGQLDDLPVEIFEGLMVNLLKSILKCNRHVVVVDKVGVREEGLNISDVNDIPMTRVFENAYFFFEALFLFLVAKDYLLSDEDASILEVVGVREVVASEGELAVFKFYND